jgi:transposase
VQEDFVASDQKLEQNKGKHDAILFMDATHPQHNPVLGGGWIKRGRCFPLKSNTGWRRRHINGVIDVARMHAVMCYDDTIDAASTIALFEQIEVPSSKAATITMFSDNARYYRSKAVRAYLEHSRIALQFLPPYSPNLNLIERFWKFFKRKVLYNRYYETFADYKAAFQQFFADLDAHAKQRPSLLTENFEIIRG